MNISAYAHRVATILRHPSNRGARNLLGVARRSVALRLAILEKRPIEFDFLAGTRIRSWPNTHASGDLAYYRIPDYAQMTFMERYLRPDDNVLDVGANVGLYSILAAAVVGPGGHVDAVEAVPTTGQRFLENVALNHFNHRITLHQMAVGADTDWVEMTNDRDAVNCIVLDGREGSSQVVVRVPVGRLDDIAAKNAYAFGKIDIEGREWDAFRGAQGLLKAQTPPVWVVEVNGGLFRYGHQVAPFIGWMAEMGFQPWMYHPDENILKRMYEDAWGDVFFVANDRLSFLNDRLPGLRIVT